MYTLMQKTLAHSLRSGFTHLQLSLCNAFVFASKSFSSLVTEDYKLEHNSILIPFLVNSCGFSRKRAEAVYLKYGHKMKMDSSEKADSVLELLKNHGFTTTDFSKIFSSVPNLLLIKPEKTLLPKIQFLHSIGFSKEDIRRFFCRNPVMMARSLEKHILPLHGFIRSVLGDDEKAAVALKRGGWLLLRPHTVYLIPNISFLKENGVPQSRIEYLLLNHTGDLLMKHSDFCKVVTEVAKLGFHPTKTMFLLAIHAMAKGFKSTRERCIKVYKEYGWSEGNIREAFLKYPTCLLLSEKKLRSTLEFLVKKAGYRAEEIAAASCILSLGLESRIIPRYSVIQALSLMGLTDKKFALGSVLLPSDYYFIKRFVHKYDETAPQLLSVYQGKLDPFQSNTAHFTSGKLSIAVLQSQMARTQ